MLNRKSLVKKNEAAIWKMSNNALGDHNTTNQDRPSVPLLTVMRSSITLKNWKVTWNKLRNTDNINGEKIHEKEK